MNQTSNNSHNTVTTPLLGRTADGPIEAPRIEQWGVNPNVIEVTFVCEELQALCPVTKQPDIYSLRLSYTGSRTFESKGMKHYLWGFRDRPISAEDLASTIADDLTKAIGAVVNVGLVQNVRGGLQLSVEAVGSNGRI